MDDSPVNRELSLFSFEILGLVGQGGAGAHDLLRMARHGRVLDWAGESQYYVEPKRLAKLGYLEAHQEPGRTRPRTVYSLTEQGREALREDLEDVRRRIEEGRATAAALPHRTRYLDLVNDFLAKFADLHEELADE